VSQYLVRRLIQFPFILFAVATLVFVIMHAIGDPARLLLNPEGTRQDLANLEAALGLDQPLYVQYLRYLAGLVHGDFGSSFRYHQPALQLVLERLPATLLLTGVSLGVMVPFALTMGILSATHRNGPLDFLATAVAVAGRALPSFWLGLLLILVFSVQFPILPPSGYGDPSQIIMPALTLGLGLAAAVTRLTRSSMLDVLQQDYVRTARAKGLGNQRVLLGHALRSALIPVVTILALQLGAVLSGSVIVETIFAWPGVGRLIVDSIFQYDYPVVEAAVLCIAVLFLVLNLATDLLYGVLDPRSRVDG
jgi:peptide/nickel transport system permease protein